MYRIRFRGIKGVVAVEPGIDEMAKWAESLGLESPNPKINIWSPHCMFRPSQDKFKSTKTVKEQLEMVKYSSPVPVALNKPFINILDQVSEHQSFTSHRRICERIEELLDMQMRHFARFILDESFCRNKLKEFPHRVDIDSLPMSSGFTLSAEPFFRSLIKASIKASVVKQLRKEQIPIPHEMGRSMLGVIDETGRLQYGQVFGRYTRSIHVKLPPETATRLVLTGPVMITKNPCIVPGDVRMFEAVDIPELHHHCDVLVFPQSGPRPHPDQMAGSDLDGDEYSVIWDKRLYFDHNEEPFDFACEKVQDDIAERNVERLMRNHYIEYLKLDAVGTIANNHLHQSDQYGLYSDIAMNLAKKNCDAVDFTKTDRAPAPLRYNWMTLTEEEEDGSTTNIDMPPERAERVPDYHFGNDVTPVYVSPRLAGSLFRELKAIDDVMKVNEEMEERIEVVMDAQIDWPGWEEFLETAQTQLARYNSQLRAIMENYGIKNESELFSGCVVEVRNRISDRDQDDMSYFNTNQVIETKMHNLYKAFRENFFEEFGRNGWKQFTTKIDKTYADEENVFHRLCKHPSEEMVRKAVACYKVCYSEAMRSTESKKLSFAWLAFEILAEVKKRKSMTVQTHHMTRNPIFDILDKHRAEYIEENRGEFTNFLHTRLTRTMSTSKQREQAFTIIRSYMNTYLGLDEVLFILLEWADRCLLFKKSSFREQHLCLLLILFITNHFLTRDAAKVNLESDIYIEVLRNPSALPQPARLPSGRAARITLSFFEFLASRRFRRLSSLSFVSLGFMSVFNRGQWLPVHQSALKTYYNILFNLRFEELPLPTDPEIVTSAIAREHETLVIELPETVNIPNMEDILRKTTGLEAIKIRKSEKVAVRADVWASDKKPKRQINKYILSSRGTLEAFYELKKIISVRIHVKTSSLTKELSTQLAQLTYEKIMNSKGREHLPSAFQ
ncbi:hypothetical protein WR25_15503 isoform A [Diploscapter pachys]|uniref:RNA-dependent RNA polymerase n=1 Tax=Diploscapter pachys TaxID=2018661 RepID=A0A2A2J456_9BILA|nr:hypothetical protein WR25_15503 isoform A [Diploscapter pachys]